MHDVFCLQARISTHAPRTGSDVASSYTATDSLGISTHAPRTGSDNAR